MSKLPKEKRDKIILVAMVTVVASAALWLLVIKNQQGALTKARAEAVTAEDQLKRGQTTLQTKATIAEEFESASATLRQKEAGMAAPNDMYSWLIQTLNTFKAGRQVEIPQFGREQQAEVGVFPKFPYRAAIFNVRGTAHYHDLGRFLADFENQFPCIRVQNIELEPAATESGTPREKLNFKLELLTLVRPVAQ